jgi:hypothetical protein
MKKLLFIIFTVICFVSAHGQKFTASADLTSIALGDIIHLTYTLDGGTGTDFIPPDFSGMRVLQGPEVANEFHSVNGQTSASMTVTYLLQAMQKGKFVIGPARIKFQGKTLTSNSVTLKVTEDAGANQKGAQNKNRNGETLFLKAVANKTDVVEGEAISVTYRLYVADNVRMNAPTVTKMPTFTGFWSEAGSFPPQLPAVSEIYKGKHYSVYLIRKLILFPQKSGSLTLDPLEIECSGQTVMPVQVNPNDPLSDMFDNMFNTTAVPFHKVIVSNPIIINASQLPAEGKPASFSGMVGKAAIAATSDQTNVKANEPVSFHLTIGGEGNLSLQQAPKLNLSADIEVYEPKITDKFDRTGDNLTGTRTFDYTLMPHKEGKFEIPAIAFSYYDPVKKEYFESKTVPLTLNVEKNNNPQNTGQTGEVKSKKSWSPYVKWGILLGTALLLLAAVLLFVKQKVKLPVRPEKEEVIALQEPQYIDYLNRAVGMVNHDEHGEFYTMMLGALYGFMEEYLDMPMSDITHVTLRQGMEQKGVPETDTNSYLSLVDECEIMNYAPAGFSADKESIYNRGKEMIEKIRGQR